MADTYRTLVPFEHPGTLVPRLAEPYGPFENLLDVGGGGGVVGSDVWKVKHIQILDLFPPATPGAPFTLGDGLDAVKIFGANSFDVVQCTETIEHLTKEDGKQLLGVLEEVARKFVVLTTPNGFSDQDPAKVPWEPWANNPHQKHLSGWSPEEFTEAGYEVLLNGGPVAAPIVAYKDMRGR
jgi:hypothetical protein